MSANRDRSQKIAFVYSNLYRIYKEGKTEASKDISSPILGGPISFTPGIRVDKEKFESHQSGNVIKAGDSKHDVKAFAAKKLNPLSVKGSPIDDLKKNLDQLNSLQEKLSFMLKELEDLTKDKK